VTFQVFDPRLWARVSLVFSLKLVSFFSALLIILLVFRLIGIAPSLSAWFKSDVGSWLTVAAVGVGAWPLSKEVQKWASKKPPSKISPDPSPWLPTTYDLPLDPPFELSATEAARRRLIAKIVPRYYSTSVRGPYFVRVLKEPECGSENYCLRELFSRRSHLLRFHRRIDTIDNVRRLQAIEIGVAQSGVFAEFGKYLVPLQPDRAFATGTSFVRYQAGDGKIELAALYPFVDEVTRFEGSEIELESLAESYGRLQSVVADKDWQEPDQDRGWVDEKPGELRELLLSISHVRTPDRIAQASALDLIRKNADLISFCLERSLPLFELRSRRHNRSQLLLHDLHPRNSFFRDGRCVLIYDYECMTRTSPELEAAAFALHRYSRKMIINHGLSHRLVAERKSHLRRFVELFQESYNRGRGFQVLTDNNFTSVLDALIMLTNLQKILYCGRPACFRTDDPGNRSPEVLYAELVKYIRCLAEAKEYCFAPLGRGEQS
jgi:hypothetical protein